MRKSPLVSVIVPCRNEENFIKFCVDSIIENDYPKNCLEIIFVDGMSTDKTVEILEDYKKKYNNIEILTNPKVIFPSAVNLGVRKSSGDYIMIMGAHATYKNDYISKSVKYLDEYGIDNAGGILYTIGQEQTFVAKIILKVLTSPFGVGNSKFRTGSDKPIEVDTVFGGCYKRSVFEKIGFLNENLVSSSDIEFNIRLKRAGGKISLFPDIIATYYTRTSFKKFVRNNFRNGFWAIYPLRFVSYMPVSFRHFVPLLLFISLAGSFLLSILNSYFFFLFVFIISLYLLASIAFSIKYIKENLLYIVLLPFFFFIIHFSYGIGSLYAGFIILFSKIIKTKSKT